MYPGRHTVSPARERHWNIRDRFGKPSEGCTGVKRDTNNRQQYVFEATASEVGIEIVGDCENRGRHEEGFEERGLSSS